jgi:selenocysteine lyase/cysteine desulfurase
VAYGWGMPNIGEGDEIVVSILEHHSNIVPWHFIRERQGAKLVWAPVDDEGAFHLDDFEKALTARTKLVAITQMSNALGTVTPIKEICRIAHARGIPVLVDGSQSAVHMPVDVQALDCDWFVMTGHKLYGPSGIGVLYGKKELLEKMRPFQGGGEMIFEVTKTASPITTRRTVSRPARRRSCRRSGWAPRSTIWKASGANASRRMKRTARLCARAPARDQFAAHHRRRAGQGRHRFV